uniref:Uncharacterized protein n=1 Tax=Magallana gigas TaxID=29159 RepID=A0A8W8NYI3_MAGGI
MVSLKGCPTPGYYGEDCSLPCPQNCQEGHCHIVGGTCLGCVPGYIGPTCDKNSPTSDQMSTCQSSTPFYTSLALLIFSGLMNVFLVLRQLRNRRCSTKKNAGNTDKHQGRINRKLEQATSLPMSASNHYENDPEETKQEPPYDELQ